MRHRPGWKWRFALGGAFVVAAVLAWGARSRRWAGAELTRTLASPDGRYELLVFRRPMPFSMPGQGSDAPGLIRLREMSSGRVLRELELEMVQLVDQVQWSPTNVDIGVLANWPLPP